MKALLIEDEYRLALNIRKGLEEKNYMVDFAYDGFIGNRLAMENNYNVIILDLIIPGMNGFDLCRSLRNNNIETPIIALTALSGIEDKLLAFEAGADDYLAKPFEFRELLARLNALLKRSAHITYTNDGILSAADVTISLKDKSVNRAGEIISLTAKEYMLLEYMIRNKNRLLSRADIAQHAWKLSLDNNYSNIVDVYINFLRKKIDKNQERKLIHTVVGMGYILKDE